MARFMLQLPAAPLTAFEYLADPARRPEWQSSLRGVELLDAGPPRVGTRWVDRTAVGARPRLQIVELTPPGPAGEPGAWSEVGTWHGLRAALDLTFTPTGAGGERTLLGVRLRLESGLLWTPVRLVLQALAPSAVGGDLARAGELLRRMP